MSERMTSIHLPNLPYHAGRAEWGRVPAAEMIAIIRRSAERDKEVAEAILAAADEDFHIETYLGVNVKRNREVIQDGLTSREVQAQHIIDHGGGS